jgi:hypothetical protein
MNNAPLIDFPVVKHIHFGNVWFLEGLLLLDGAPGLIARDRGVASSNVEGDRRTAEGKHEKENICDF